MFQPNCLLLVGVQCSSPDTTLVARAVHAAKQGTETTTAAGGKGSRKTPCKQTEPIREYTASSKRAWMGMATATGRVALESNNARAISMLKIIASCCPKLRAKSKETPFHPPEMLEQSAKEQNDAISKAGAVTP